MNTTAHQASNSNEGSGLSTLVETDVFRNLMRKLAGSVTVITTENEGNLHGFTATAVCSVCADPPSILIVVNRSARTHPHIDKKGAFAVNILGEAQAALASHFATKSPNQFDDVEHSITPRGVPIISAAAAYIECRIVQKYDVGTHTIFIGHVIDGSTELAAPLIYHDAQYARAIAI